jgi:hypothetical protein
VEIYEKVGYSTPEALESEVFNHKSPGTFFFCLTQGVLNVRLFHIP